ncbi:DUF2087 domain-containing protein [Sporosarcina sp. GW1-11]|uniref:DUF2087 domain-containing protein n=1 Tax=Sporosarcina sp. GW1-11 TaxID=2899126 RepID=UPI00294D802D|nr:DUF2087 domain-containing protein [Sporosarcina sp. GW1-11]MDV6377045.1 DUF2087 domain-containing protein [Sporosarcina sp. GW1-11]
METSEQFWDATLDELKQGYIEEKDSYRCLLCDKAIEKGIIYPYENALYEAERFMRVHIEHTHQSVFSYLIDLDKKLTGLTDHQGDLLRLFYQGKTDKEIQEELEIGSAATVRHHRFALKEKERQAKTFLAMMELIKKRDEQTSAFLTPQKAAQLLHDESILEENEKREIIQRFFPEGVAGPMNEFPATEKQRLIVMEVIAQRLNGEITYSEREIEQLLQTVYADVDLVKKSLIDYALVGHTRDGSQYWLK